MYRHKPLNVPSPNIPMYRRQIFQCTVASFHDGTLELHYGIFEMSRWLENDCLKLRYIETVRRYIEPRRRYIETRRR